MKYKLHKGREHKYDKVYVLEKVKLRYKATPVRKYKLYTRHRSPNWLDTGARMVRWTVVLFDKNMKRGKVWLSKRRHHGSRSHK
jgi:hypothetical protein